jgi:hypothetical protein
MAARQFLCSVSLYSAWLPCGANWVAKPGFFISEITMKTLIIAATRCSLIFTAVAALSIAYPASVQAVPTTYQYTGNPFTEVSGVYTTSMFVTAMVTLAAPLAPNTETEVTPIAFTLFDGVQTITNNNTYEFVFATGPSGAITGWLISGGGPSGISTIKSTETADGGNVSFDSFGFNINTPGTWTTGVSVADTGSTLSLMTLTFMALGVAARRFERAAA